MALDIDTGTERWTARPPDALSFLGAMPGRGLVLATVGTCDSGMDAVIPQGLVALDAATGRTRWETASTNVVGTIRPLSTYVYAIAPADAAGVVVTTSEQGIQALRAKDGTPAWSTPEDTELLGVTASTVYVVDGAATELRALDRRSGRLRWTNTTVSAPFVIAAADAGHVAIATGDTGGQPPSQVTFVVLDAQTGAEVSRFDAGHPERFDLSEVALRDGHLDYAQRSSIVSRRTSNGEQAWRRRIDNQAGAVTMARSPDNRTVFALRSGSVGSLAALDAISGDERWSHTGYLAAAGDQTAVLGRPHPSRTLRGIDATSGARRWQREIPSDLAPIGTLGLRVRAAGDLLVLSNDCNVG